MRFTCGYFELPKLLPKPDSRYYKSKMMNVPIDELNSRQFRGALPHLYKRFLRLHSFIDFSTATITKHRMAGLYASIIRAKFQVLYIYPSTASVELVGDTDMFVKLRNIRQKYESCAVDEREKFLEDNLDTLIRNNYLHHSMESFVSFYNMLLVDISKNNGKFINWMLTKNVSLLENGSDIDFVRNNLLYGSIFNFDTQYYLRREVNSYGWKNLYNGTYPFSAGMKGAYNPKVVNSRKDLNDHVYIDTDYKVKTREDLFNEEQTFFTNRYKSMDSLLRRQQQRAMFHGVLWLKNNFSTHEDSLDVPDNKNKFSALFRMLHNDVHATNNVSAIKNFVSYLQYDSTKKRKFMENTLGGGKNASRLKGAMFLKTQKQEIEEIKSKVKTKADGDIKDMVLFLEGRSKSLDTMKHGFIRFTHNVLTSGYLKKKFILPYIRGEL